MKITRKPNCCIIAAVGVNSLHKSWIDPMNRFDLHLITYDDSIEDFRSDTQYIVKGKGQKLTLIYDYLRNNATILEQYEYFYFPDDDIFIDDVNIWKMFELMRLYNLSIAQPALANSYYTFPITVKQSNSILRFTNFVEIMQPCFSKQALKDVLFTFNENESNWGPDYHWGELVNYRKKNVAILDCVFSVHSRQVGELQPRHLYLAELENYLKKYNLKGDIIELGRIRLKNIVT